MTSQVEKNKAFGNSLQSNWNEVMEEIDAACAGIDPDNNPNGLVAVAENAISVYDGAVQEAAAQLGNSGVNDTGYLDEAYRNLTTSHSPPVTEKLSDAEKAYLEALSKREGAEMKRDEIETRLYGHNS